MQGTQRYVVFAYLALGFLVFMTMDRLLGALFYAVELPNPGVIGSGFTLVSLIGLAAAVGLGFFLYRHPRANEFSHEVVTELRKVTWPSRKETQSQTVVVIITTIIIALILGLFDFIWAELTGLIYL